MLKNIPGFYLARGALGLALVVALWWSWDSVLDFLRAPVQTQLDVSLATNKGFAKATENQNKGVEGLKTSSDARKAQSSKAVAAAGAGQFKRAAEIQQAAPVGESDYDRARNRIDRELGLQ